MTGEGISLRFVCFVGTFAEIKIPGGTDEECMSEVEAGIRSIDIQGGLTSLVVDDDERSNEDTQRTNIDSEGDVPEHPTLDQLVEVLPGRYVSAHPKDARNIY